MNLRYLGQFDWGKLEARVYHEDVDHFMDFGADKKYWYKNPPGPTYNGTPCGVSSATCAAGMPMYTESKNTGAVVKADIDLTQQDLLRVGTEYQRYRLDDWWPASGAAHVAQHLLERQRWRARPDGAVRRMGNAVQPAMVDAGRSALRARRDGCGDVQGYNLNTYPTVVAASGDNQTRDAADFNNADHSKTDNNWDMTALARYTPDAMRDIEFGFARKTRSPNLYERYTWSTWQMAALMVNLAGDGNGYIGNLDLEPEKAQHRVRDLRLACCRPPLGVQSHALLHPCERLH